MLYDRPAEQFKSITLAEKHELFYRLSEDFPEFLGPQNLSGEQESTRFTYKDANGTIHHRSDRPAIIVSSTSWTPDEDFSILLKALERKRRRIFLFRHRLNQRLFSNPSLQATNRLRAKSRSISHTCSVSSPARVLRKPRIWAKSPG